VCQPIGNGLTPQAVKPGSQNSVRNSIPEGKSTSAAAVKTTGGVPRPAAPGHAATRDSVRGGVIADIRVDDEITNKERKKQ
jgi:hypothetical protein